MEPAQLVKLILHTNAGSRVETVIPAPADEEPDEIAAGLADELAQRPRWMSIGNLTIFSGAITAIEVDLYDTIPEAA